MRCTAMRDVRRADQEIVGEFVVAGGVGGRHAALVHPEEVDLVPGEPGRREFLKQQLRRGAAGNREGRELLSGEGFVQHADNVMRAGLGGRRCIG